VGFSVERVIYGVAMGRRREIVLLLHREGPMTLAKLRSSLGVSASTLLFELSALESLGVVRREDSLVYLTELGGKVASILSSTEPLKSLSFLSVIGLRPLVVWLLVSPYLRVAAAALLLGWVVALVFGALQNPPLALLGVAYVGYYLPLSLGLSSHHALAASLVSATALVATSYFLTGRKMTPFKAAVGLAPLALFPATHLTFVNLARVWEFPYLVTLSQVLLFFTLLLTATMYAAVYSLEVGTAYEHALIRTLLIFYVVPALLYLAPLR
jgi:DNA-binding Lrp family transcriptional regulator